MPPASASNGNWVHSKRVAHACTGSIAHVTPNCGPGGRPHGPASHRGTSERGLLSKSPAKSGDLHRTHMVLRRLRRSLRPQRKVARRTRAREQSQNFFRSTLQELSHSPPASHSGSLARHRQASNAHTYASRLTHTTPHTTTSRELSCSTPSPSSPACARSSPSESSLGFRTLLSAHLHRLPPVSRAPSRFSQRSSLSAPFVSPLVAAPPFLFSPPWPSP